MRHRVYGKKLGRNKNERTALFKSLVQALFTYGTIKTSESKAKAVKGLVDKVINLAKRKNTERLLQTYLLNKALEERLIKEIAPKLDDRVSGYTTLLRLGERAGDKTMMVRMSLIHSEELKPLEKKAPKVIKASKSVEKKVKPVIAKLKIKNKKKVVSKKPVRRTKKI